ncbi:hypothetical protein [Streptacidiphilus sp. MAP5-3]|uniref:hypothetical protein n=1 Tax=unclassified Streptacidiphilus TaxID=2643834 RepID=UPI00351274B9
MTAPLSIPDGSVVITPNEVYAEVRATREAVGELTRKLDQVPGRVDDHEHRLRALEERRIPHSSVTVITAVVSAGALIAAVWPAFGH